MIKQISSLLGQIVRRVKVNSTALSATLGVMALPLGVYLIVEGGARDKFFGYCIALIGLLMIISTAILTWRAETKGRQEKERRDKVEDNRYELQTRIFVSILDELKRINSGGGKYERKDKPKQ